MSTEPSPEEAPETPDLQGAYPRLSDKQIAALDAQGRRRPTRPGDVLFAEGDWECDFFVVLAGRVASVEGRGTPEERVIAVHGRGRFLGELGLLTGEGAYDSAVALDTGEALAALIIRLRELVARDPAAGDLVLRAYLMLRSILIGLGPACGSSARSTPRTPGGSGTSRPGTGCRPGSWTWRPTRPPRPCWSSST
jgi:thioredoxin reductase (NADPH)